MPLPRRLYTLGIVGGPVIERVALVTRFMHDAFVEDYDPTHSGSYHKQILVDGVPTELLLVDYSADLEYPAMAEEYARTCSGFMMTFSLTSRWSFEKIKSYQSYILGIRKKESAPFILVGGECDQVNDRVIQPQECEELAREFGCKYFETSARMDINVHAAFEEITREIVRYEAQTYTTPEPTQKGKKEKKAKGKLYVQCVVL